MSIVYADNNATTAVAPEVYEAMVPFLRRDYFNPSSMYEAARGSADAIARARKQVAGCINAGAVAQILFTSCATESINTAIFGAVKADPQRRHIITTAVEHPAVLEVCKDLARSGHEVTFLSVDSAGKLDMREFVRALRPDTLMVSIMHANNETGVVFPIEELSRVTKETDASILFHTDATQSVSKLPIDLRGALRNVDLLSLSGHKIHAPKGIGALFVRKGTPCRPLIIGGHQEGGRRGGTENVPFIVGLGRACELAQEHLGEAARIAAIRDRIEHALGERIPYLEVNGRQAPRVANTLNVACHFVEGEGILYQLGAQDICASSGSACTSGSLEPSHVLKAMGVPFAAMHGSVRFSLSRYTTEDDADRIVEVMPPIVNSLRNLSPYWDQRHDRPRAG